MAQYDREREIIDEEFFLPEIEVIDERTAEAIRRYLRFTAPIIPWGEK